ncbi:hypothetical protein FPQ18DRAFT_347422 [Pyronema domesticum]|nr:hypothetical protein FPQ18DRAFT_347422 [Pyronema domesticum]
MLLISSFQISSPLHLTPKTTTKMHTLTLLLTLLFTLVSAQRCKVPLPLLYSLPYPFTLETQSTVYHDLHHKAVHYIPQGTPGDYRAVISPLGSPNRIEFKDSHLNIFKTKFTAYLRAPIKTVYRQVSFVTAPQDALGLVGHYECSEVDAVQVVLNPVPNDKGVSREFCVAKNPINNELGLYVQTHTTEPVKGCRPVKLVVKRIMS